MSLSKEFVFVVFDQERRVVGIYEKHKNAEASIPENLRLWPKEVHAGIWEYGETYKWMIFQMEVKDSAGLPVNPVK